MYINASISHSKFCEASGPPPSSITSSIPQPFLLTYSELGKTAQNQTGSVIEQGWSVGWASPAHRQGSSIRVQWKHRWVINHTTSPVSWRLRVNDTGQCSVVSIRRCSEDKQLLSQFWKSGPLESNRSGAQTQTSQAMDFKLPPKPSSWLTALRLIYGFPKKLARSTAHSGGHQTQSMDKKIPHQRGSNIQSQGTWNQLKYPPLLTVRELTFSGRDPEDGQPSSIRSLLKSLTSTIGSKSWDLQVTGKSVSNQAGLWHAAAVKSLCQTQHCR